jgi:hypothetical protein
MTDEESAALLYAWSGQKRPAKADLWAEIKRTAGEDLTQSRKDAKEETEEKR